VIDKEESLNNEASHSHCGDCFFNLLGRRSIIQGFPNFRVGGLRCEVIMAIALVEEKVDENELAEDHLEE